MATLLRDAGGTVSQGSSFWTRCMVYLEWQNAINNQSNVTFNFQIGTSNTGNQFSGTAQNTFIRLDGAVNNFSNAPVASGNWSTNPITVASINKTFTHDGNGDKSVDLWCHTYLSAGGWGPGHCYVSSEPYSTQVGLPKIDRTGMTVTISPSNLTTSSVNINRSWDQGADLCQYVIDGSGWINEGSKYGNILFNANNVTGLSPNTTYNLRIRMRKASNQVWTESNTITFTTHPTTVTVATLTATATSPTAISVNAVANTPANTDKIVISTAGKSATITGGSGTVSITGLVESTTYTVTAVATTKRSGATSSKTTTVTTPADSFCYIKYRNGTLSAKKKMYLIRKNGTKVEVVKAKARVL